MAVGGGAIRALFVAGFVCWYSTGVFKAMDSHFGSHFGQYLRKQISSNEHMRRDLEADRRAMERVLQAKGRQLPAPQDDDQSLLEDLMRRFRGAGAEQAAGSDGRRRACLANPQLEHKHDLLVPEACAAAQAVQDQAAHDEAVHDEALKEKAQDEAQAEDDFCPAARGPPVCEAPPAA